MWTTTRNLSQLLKEPLSNNASAIPTKKCAETQKRYQLSKEGVAAILKAMQ